MTIDRALDIMAMRADPQSKHFVRILSIQQSVIASVMSAQIRVDGDKFRNPETDELGGILAEIKAQKAVPQKPN